MGWSTPDLYYDPEKFGLTPIGEVDAGGGYDFDKFAAWRDDNGTVYWATDSGCSCPSPFEDFTSLDQAERGTPVECSAALDAWRTDWRDGAEVADLKDKLAALPVKSTSN